MDVPKNFLYYITVDGQRVGPPIGSYESAMKSLYYFQMSPEHVGKVVSWERVESQCKVFDETEGCAFCSS